MTGKRRFRSAGAAPSGVPLVSTLDADRNTMDDGDSSDLELGFEPKPSLELDAVVLRAALEAGVDNIVHVLIHIWAAPATADPSSDAGTATEAADQWPAFQDLQLDLKVPRGATYGLHKEMTQSHGMWRPSDLRQGYGCDGLARIVLSADILPPAGDTMLVATLRLWGTPLNEQDCTHVRIRMELPVVTADEYEEIPQDPELLQLLDACEGNLDAAWQVVEDSRGAGTR